VFSENKTETKTVLEKRSEKDARIETRSGGSHQKFVTGSHSSRGINAGLTHLSMLSGLQILWLKNTAVSDGGLEQLKDNTSLHTLVLSGTNVTDAGVFRLQQALPNLKIVR
jgi:hypothetical protein